MSVGEIVRMREMLLHDESGTLIESWEPELIFQAAMLYRRFIQEVL